MMTTWQERAAPHRVTDPVKRRELRARKLARLQRPYSVRWRGHSDLRGLDFEAFVHRHGADIEAWVIGPSSYKAIANHIHSDPIRVRAALIAWKRYRAECEIAYSIPPPPAA